MAGGCLIVHCSPTLTIYRSLDYTTTLKTFFGLVNQLSGPVVEWYSVHLETLMLWVQSSVESQQIL